MADEFDAVPVDTPTAEIKLFGKWSSDEVHVNDISLAVSLIAVTRHTRVTVDQLLKSMDFPPCAGLHYRKGEGLCVSSPHSRQICCKKVQEGPRKDSLPVDYAIHHYIHIVPSGRASYQLTHDAWTQQRKEAHGRDDCQTCIRDHPSAIWRCEGFIFEQAIVFYLSYSVRRILFKSWLMPSLIVARVRTPHVLAEQAQ